MRTYLLLIMLAVGMTACYSERGRLSAARRTRRQSCPSGQLGCVSGQCVSRYSICDGHVDCPDGSDETKDACDKLFHGKAKCTRGQWQCEYGACLVQTKRCDGLLDCRDGSDESGCPANTRPATQPPSSPTCVSGQLGCVSGQCVSRYSICDGHVDCPDGSDETKLACDNLFQGNNTCSRGQWQCQYGACLVRAKRCDGHLDCVDGSDEANCPQPQNPVKPPPPVVEFSSCKSNQMSCASGQCVSRYNICDGQIHCPDGSDETRAACDQLFNGQNTCSRGQWQCQYGACLVRAKRCDGKQDCRDGSDETNCFQQPTKQPPPPGISSIPNPNRGTGCEVPELPILLSDKTQSQCRSSECALPPGSTVRHSAAVVASCSRGHVNHANAMSDLVTCENGRWSPEIDSRFCDKCGTSNLIREAGYAISQVPVIVNGTASKSGNFPWHAGLYQKNQVDQWEHNCGGTLVSRQFILTAAHCVTVPSNTERPQRLAPQQIKATLGKTYRDWSRQEAGAQWLDVREVIVHEEYRGQSNRFFGDIALLKMLKDAEINDWVMPACVDFTSANVPEILQGDSPGYIAGWGNTEDCPVTCPSSVSETLLYTTSYILPFTNCFANTNKIHPNRISAITHDKFCAGNGKGSLIQQGDSGGGMTFVFDSQHYVYGIVSTKIKIEKQEKGGTVYATYGTLTNVTFMLSWLEKHLVI